MPPFPRRPATLALLALLALSSGCGDSPTAPRALGDGILAAGAVIRGTIQSVADTAHFSLVLNDGRDAVVYLMAKGDPLRIEVRDSTGRLISMTTDGHNTTAPELRGTSVIPASPYRYRVDVSMVYGTLPSDYEIRVAAANRAPEHVPMALKVGTIVRGEDIEHAYDVDSFTVTVDRDQVVDLYMRKTTRNDAIVVATVVSPPPGYFIANMWAGPADTVLGQTGSGRLALTAGGQYFIVVHGQNADTAKTGYELLLQPINSAPESSPAAVVAGDTVREAIDHLGDVDEYTLTGVPGAKYNLFADAGGTAPHLVTATVAFGRWDDPAVTAKAGGTLGSSATGVFALPQSGTATIRVEDGYGTEAGHVGPYRLFVYPIDARVEGASAALTLDKVTGSRIDMLGDVDEFTLTVATETPVNVEVRRPDTTAHGALRLTLLTASDSEITGALLGTGYPAPLDTTAVGTHWMQPGTYTVRVGPLGSQGGEFSGYYEILPYVIDPAPEHVAGVIAVGDTLRGESLDLVGDIDRFHVDLAAGDSVYVDFGGLRAGVTARAYVYRASDRLFVGGIDAAGVSDGQTRIITAPSAGDYYVEVSGQTVGVLRGETGPYWLALGRVTAAPETGPSTIALGDTVNGSLEVRGDVDQFTLDAPAGTEITGWFRGTWRYYACCVAVEFVDATTGAVVKQSPFDASGLGRVTVPAAGSLRVRIREPFTCDVFGCNGPNIRGSYQLQLTAVNRSPESRASVFTIGDTVSGESVDPIGDIDEFTFDAAAGETVNVSFQTPVAVSGYEGLTMTLVDRTTGVMLGTLTSYYPTARLEDIALTGVVLPSSGSYMIRVQGTNDAENSGVYRFRVARPGQ